MYRFLITTTISNGARIRHVFNRSTTIFAMPEKLLHATALTRCFHASSALNANPEPDDTLKRDLASHINPWDVIKAFIKGEVHDNTSRFVLAACGLLFAVGGLVILLVFSQFAVYRQQYRIESGFASIKESQTSIKETQTGIKETQTKFSKDLKGISKSMDVLVGRKNGTVSVGNECGTVPAKENEAKQG